MKNLTFKAAMLKGSQPTVNRQSTDGQSQRHCKQTPLSKRWKVLMTLVFLFTMGIGQMWGADEVKLVSEGTTAISKIANIGDAPTYLGTVASPAVYESSDKSYSVSISTNFSVNEGSEYKPDGSTKYKDYYYNVNGGCDMSVDPTNYIKVSATGCKISKIVLRAECFNSTPACLTAVGFISGLPETSKIGKKTGRIVDVRITDQVGNYNSIKSFANAKTLTYTFSTNVSEVYFSKQIKSIATSEETAFASYPSSSQSSGVFGIDVYVVPNPPTTYTVTLNPNGGATNDENWTLNEGNYTKSNIAKDASVALPEMTRTGYTFAVWKNANNETVNSPITVTENVTLNATWNIKSYSLTWNIPGDAVITNSDVYTHGTVAYGTAIVAPTLTREGYDFLGWNPAVAETMPDDPLTYTAQWQIAAAKHDISYTNLKEQSVDGYPTQYTEGIGIASFDALSDVAGFHFTGWSPDAIPADATDDPFVVAAQWVPTYSVTYNLNGAASGTQPTETAKYAGEVFTLAAQGDIVAPANKRFAGWKDQDDNKYAAEAEFTMPGKPVTLTAQWVDVVTYVASFACANAAPANWEFSKAASDTYGAEAATADYVCKFVAGGTSTPSQTTGDGTSDNDVAFAKNTDAIATYDLGFTTTVTALNVTLCGGSKSGFDETIEYLGEDKSTVKKSYVTSLNAGNWKDNAISKTEDVADVRFIRVHGAGKWVVMKAFSVSYIDSRTKYDVTFAKNGGSGDNMPTLKYAKDEEVTLPACTFTAPDNKEFDAWTSTDVTIANNKFTMPEKNVTITATWKAVTPKYHVTYDGNSKTSGTVPTDATAYEEGDEVTVLGKGDLARIIDGNAATFYGWNTKADMTGTHYGAGANFNIQNANVTLYAEWGYSIEYKLNNGSWKSGYTAPNHYIYGKGVTLPTAENVERVGFEFDAWYSEWHVINDGGYIDANKRIAVGPSDYGNASYLASWTALPLGPATTVDFVDFIANEGTSGSWQQYLTDHNYAIESETGVSLDNNNAFDTGLKMKDNVGNTLTFTIAGGKLMVLTVGNINGMTIAFNGGSAQSITGGTDATHLGVSYYYSADDREAVITETASKYNIIRSIVIDDPYVVTYDATTNGGTAVDPATATFYGTALILPAAVKGTETFLGWFDAAEGGSKIGDAGESYIPTASITLYAHWEAISTDARLSAITFSSNAGTLSPAFNPEVTNYTYTMPYGTASVPQITGATAVNANAQAPIIGDAATAWGEAQTIKGVAESDDKKTYTITMLQAPKDGVSIIKATINSTTKNTIGEVTGIYKKDASTSGLSSYKFNGKGAYIGLELMAGQTFQAGDIINIHTTQASTQGSIALYNDHGNTVTPFHDYEIMGGQGDNKLVLPAAADGKSIIYVCRTEANTWNGYVDFIDVTRAMMPELTAITIDERDGEIDPQDDKHFNVTIPYEADLAALTVDPTIVWNGAHATTPMTVISHEGAWVLAADGDNTYRIMDKDGDYTDYTITLTRDVKRYTVSFNAQGGSTVQSELVVAGEKLAAAPADPTREDYLFLGWAEAAEGEVVDVTDIVINADKTFYAQWKYENPIVILDENGDIDHDNFFTGMGKGTVNFGGADHNCISFGSTASTIVGATGSNKFIVYNAKTTQTRIKFVLYNTQSSAKNIVLQKVAEGETAPTNVVIEVPSQQQFTTEYYAYNSDENRSMYVYTENTGIKVLQVKVIESGTPIHQAGQAGYVLNLNKGRVFAPSNEDVEFEGLSMKVSSNYKALNSEVLQTQNNLSFQVNELVTMTLVSTGAKYQVSKDPAGSGKEYAAGTNKHTLTQGTWYIVSSTGSNIKFTNISFEEPVADHTRDNLNPSFLGTLCWTNDAILGGATLYEFAGKDEHNYLVFDEVEENRLEAGKPYIFMPENGNTEIKVYNIDESDPMTESQLQPVNNMYGTLDGKTLVPGVDDNMYYFSSNHIWAVKDFTVNIPILPNRCYIDYPAVLAAEPAPTTPAPGRHRVTMGVQGSQIATGVGEIEASETPMKVMIDGQLFIIRGEKMFDATGKLVK